MEEINADVGGSNEATREDNQDPGKTDTVVAASGVAIHAARHKSGWAKAQERLRQEMPVSPSEQYFED